MQIKILKNEYWWCGVVNKAHEMPYSESSAASFDMDGGLENDQFTPLMLSSKGRYVWSEASFHGEFNSGIIKLSGSSEIELCDGFENLRGAYLAAMEKHFDFQGKMPDKLFWKAPQYNTWIELGTNQSTENILEYARGIIANGLIPGIMMIDGGWQEDYGTFEFHGGKIPNPKPLIDTLHKMDFKVMLWVSPIVSSAGPQYRYLSDNHYLVRDKNGDDAIRKWWSGYSAVLDFTNPAAVAWYDSQLKRLIEKYGVDGFKFDAGDRYFYDNSDITYKKTTARDMTAVFNAVGEKYQFNEFRAAWKFGGRAIVARLHDKYHTWNDFGLNTIIPHTVMQGLCGYAYGCPDMVGGGIIDCFKGDATLDEELFVRWAQANALMGMMQLSISPWRVLKNENAALVTKAVKLHTQFADYIYSLAESAAKTGEPIVRHMAYEFPDEGLEQINSQFMLGSDILAAPIVEKGATKKTVYLPKGAWTDSEGNVYNGGKAVQISVNAASIIYFKRTGKHL